MLALNKEVLGFTNSWYEPALRNALPITLPGGPRIRVITAPYFLATKMEAFRGRGRMDYQASHDLEDFVAIIEGRESVVREIEQSARSLRDHLSRAAQSLLAETRFLDVLPGFVLDHERVPLIENRLDRLQPLLADSCQLTSVFGVVNRHRGCYCRLELFARCTSTRRRLSVKVDR